MISQTEGFRRLRTSRLTDRIFTVVRAWAEIDSHPRSQGSLSETLKRKGQYKKRRMSFRSFENFCGLVGSMRNCVECVIVRANGVRRSAAVLPGGAWRGEDAHSRYDARIGAAL
jgi:hypothetical protein